MRAGFRGWRFSVPRHIMVLAMKIGLILPRQ
jgi:hypothetical protein